MRHAPVWNIFVFVYIFHKGIHVKKHVVIGFEYSRDS